MSSLDPLSSVITALRRESIIPDVLPETFTPSSLLSVVWPNNKEALLGNELEKADVAEEPEFRIIPLNIPAEQADSDNTEITYTIAFFDPDAPSRADAKFKSFRHWVITGLKLPIGGEAALASKPATTPYRPPAPGPGTNYHRYTFLLFQEPVGGISIAQGEPEYGAALEERRSWNALTFGDKYGLRLLAANFFTCKVDVA